jgi:vancomycin permeability regulator SanA
VTLRNIIKLIGTLLLLLAILLFPFVWITAWSSVDSNTKPGVALVLGAGIRNNSTPSQVLEKRLEASVDLYNRAKVKKLLVSGDNSSEYYNEPEVMKNYLLKQGIPEEDIIQDFGGRRTLDSCWRAKNAFKVEKLYVVTQQFHIGRTTYLCRSVGLTVIPVVAKDSSLQVALNGYIREIGASWVAIWEANTSYQAEIKPDGTETNLSEF